MDDLCCASGGLSRCLGPRAEAVSAGTRPTDTESEAGFALWTLVRIYVTPGILEPTTQRWKITTGLAKAMNTEDTRLWANLLLCLLRTTWLCCLTVCVARLTVSLDA